jgi:hypothetical protein
MTRPNVPAAGSDPDEVVARAMAFQPAKLLLTAVELGMFEALASGPVAEAQLRDGLGLHPRGAADFLQALVALGAIQENDGRYQAGPLAGTLLPHAPTPLTGFLRMANRVMYPAWGRLAEALRTGAPQAATYCGSDMFRELYERDDTRRELVRMAEDASSPLIPALVERFDWRSYKSVLELGGCRGNVLAEVVRAHPHLDAHVLDLPQLAPEFAEHMTEIGMTGRLAFHAADFFVDQLPEADVIMIGHCMVDWNDEQRQTLIRRVAPRVHPGGVFLIWDPIVVPGEESYLRNLIRSLNLQLMTPHGSGYRLAECMAWLTEVGFRPVDHAALGHDVTLVVAHKAG